MGPFVSQRWFLASTSCFSRGFVLLELTHLPQVHQVSIVRSPVYRRSPRVSIMTLGFYGLGWELRLYLILWA